MSETNAKSRSELKREYREKPPPAGVYAVRCTKTGKVAVGSAMNVQGALNRIEFELKLKMHKHFPGLQKDCDQFGIETFRFEVLDHLPPAEDPTTSDPKEELKVLESLWLERLKPFGDAGYNVPAK